MKTCVIILNWNNPAQTRACIESLFAHENDISIIVVDNGSDKAFQQELMEVLSNYSFLSLYEGEEDTLSSVSGTNRIVYWLNDNYGYAKGNNTGLRLASRMGFQYVAICNNDVVFIEPVCEKLVSQLENNPDVALVGPRIHFRNTYKQMNPMKSQSSFGYLFWYKLFYPFVVIFRKLKVVLARQRGSHSRLLDKNEYLSGCFFVARLSRLEDIDFFDEETFLYGEEEILTFKLEEKGYLSLFWSEVAIVHNHAQTTKALTEKEVSHYSFCSKRYYVEKYKQFGRVKLLLIDFANYVWKHLWLPLRILIKSLQRER